MGLKEEREDGERGVGVEEGRIRGGRVATYQSLQ